MFSAKTKLECSLKILKVHDFFVFSQFMIRAEKACNKFTHQICAAFVRDWLEYLIHIHRNQRVFLHFRLLVDE